MARTKVSYKAAIDSFTVGNYCKGDGKTYCNVYAFDVMKHNDIAAPLPADNNGAVKGCGAMYDDLSGNKFPKWCSVTFKDAQTRANSGIPAIAISKTPGHMVVVYPSSGTPSVITDVVIAQAGKFCFVGNTLDNGWGKDNRDDIRFYSWYD